MKMKLYSLRDDLAEVFNKPFTETNDATAQRVFQQAMSENPNKNDYTLYLIGEYNDNSGLVVPMTAPKRIISGLECFSSEDNLQEAV